MVKTKELVMIKIQYILLLLLATTLCASTSYGESLKVAKNGKYESIQVIKYQTFNITSDCAKNKCLALEATKKKVVTKVSRVPLLGNPASTYCKSAGGVSRILIGQDKKQYDYCMFQDESMIDSWDLYYKHNPKAVAN